MLVAIVSPYDWSVPGGAQGQVALLARALARREHDVVVAAPGPRPVPPAAPSEYQLVALGRSFRIPVNGSVAPVAPTPAAAARCVDLLRRRRPDVVHVHEPLAPGPSLAAVLLGPRPMVATFHRAGVDPLYRLEGRVLGGAMRRVAEVVAVSEAAKDTAAEVLGSALASRIEIVPNGVEIAAAPEAPEPAELAAGGIARAVPRITFVGRHEHRKGLAVLLDAVSRLQIDVALNVIGDGPQSSGLRRQYAENSRIRWLGAVSDAERNEVLAKSTDLFVAPSVGGESFGVILLEAMAAGAPVLASDLPGYRLAVGDGGAARLVRPGDPAALAAEITSLLADPAALAALHALGRQRAQACSTDSIAARYEDLYRRARDSAP